MRRYRVRATGMIPGQRVKRNRKEKWNGLEQFKESRVYTGRQIPKTRPGILHIFSAFIRHPNVVTHGEGKCYTPNLSAEDGSENTACCVERQGDEC